ncbi:DUF4861 family protein [Moheibacter sediminis]|uniref:DUF4861 domain-containing protein n=1 Tax=Moheibacter sediminis TaxID=1434700 RepID=A0A1W2CVI3_9FLAO|nr:DUF4861 family protein [Moheibacter sediminis]SMC89257.1 protein of unknown function [Moheibacter sediminis]
MFSVKKVPNLLLLAACMIAVNCKKDSVAADAFSVSVENELDFAREEVVAVQAAELKNLLEKNKPADIRVKLQGETEYLPLQWIDYDSDGKEDELVFQVKIEPKTKLFYEFVADASKINPKSKAVAYSRIVPERFDDYTWENEKIAFRVYGPKGQEEALKKTKGATLSSGVDIWLKRTDKSVIDEWYKGYLTDPMFYHVDKGEGYDPYHVGDSRGTGALGVWDNGELLVSQNFTAHKTISAGPLRTVFELTYAPWSDYKISETKRITLDIGSNFSKFESNFKSEKPVPNYTAGITLHRNEGEANINSEKGWFRHWEKIDDAYVGQGIVIDPSIVDTAFTHKSDVVDQSNLLVVTKPAGKLTYYAGFAWQKSGQVNTVKDWEKILDKQAQILASPLKIVVVK